MIGWLCARPPYVGNNTSFFLSLGDKAAETSQSQDALTKADIVSVTPQIHGDWVLFHPVYTDEELRAVQV